MSDGLLSFIGVAVGSLLTLFVTWISNRHGSNLQKSQLDFESKERQKERQLQMRIEVYLPAVDAIVGMAVSIGRGATPTVSNAEFDSASQILSLAIARVQMVASEETIRRVSALQRAFAGELLAMMRDRHSLALRQMDIDIAAERIRAHREEQGRYLEMMRAFNRDDRRDVERWNAIQSQSDYVEGELDRLVKLQEELLAKQVPEQVALARSIPARMESIMGLQVQALVAVRTELELAGASTVLTEELQATAKELQKALERTLDTLTLPISE